MIENCVSEDSSGVPGFNCPSCGYEGKVATYTLGPFGACNHWAKLECPVCARFFKWAPTPPESKKRRSS
jgi:hypothetical protein